MKKKDFLTFKLVFLKGTSFDLILLNKQKIYDYDTYKNLSGKQELKQCL